MDNTETGVPIMAVKGERALWRAVITQALMDASSNSKKMELKYEKSQALCWLSAFSEDFRCVCDHAGFDPVYVRTQAVEALKRGCVWRAPSARKLEISNKKEEKILEEVE